MTARTVLIGVAALALTIAFGGTAAADGKSGAGGKTGFGFGAESMLTSSSISVAGFDTGGLSGPALLYEGDKFHIAGLLQLSDVDPATVFGVAGRIYFPVHRGDRSDFSVGGGFGILQVNIDTVVGNADTTDFHLEGGAQARVWLTDNVTLSGTFGLGIIVGDNDRFGTSGQLLGSIGLGYYFF